MEQEQYQRNLLNGAAEDEAARAEFLSRPSVMLGLVPMVDGNKWSVLYGSNIMEGVVAFGDTPDEAMRAFDDAWVHERPPDVPAAELNKEDKTDGQEA